ncbi:MAG: hypothetical protein A3B70_06830 [Deltaproteobacteria bacterium RIFCSPHIGHO2_02_FULL_40_11]|nr:MAG: hypothetical protein A3B70_06830 [Deltaproteobacteria bacterium RIFCSPHIGHO2_02_FULL_40_11]
MGKFKKDLKSKKHIVGWREWVSLPDLHIQKIKVKVDTGARTSTLHAAHISVFKRGKYEYVRFSVDPIQASKTPHKVCTARIIERRQIMSSIGVATLRPIIRTKICLADIEWSIEVTLVNRDIMGFRMLIGRQAIRGNFFVDPGRSFILSSEKSKRTKSKIQLRRVEQ